MDENTCLKSDHFADLDLQIACQNKHIPSQPEFQIWVEAACTFSNKKQAKAPVLSLRVVDIPEIQALNHTYRYKNKPTNVLSFPSDLPEAIQEDTGLLGDIIICADIVEKEAEEQNKMLKAHWAHMVVHGCLHLLGYDHEEDKEASKMESLEIRILESLGLPNPY